MIVVPRGALLLALEASRQPLEQLLLLDELEPRDTRHLVRVGVAVGVRVGVKVRASLSRAIPATWLGLGLRLGLGLGLRLGPA